MKPHSYPPGPKSRYPFEVTRRFMMDPIAFLTELSEKYGDISVFRAPTPIYFFNHPDLIRDLLVVHAKSFHKGRVLERAKVFLGEGLLTSEGEFHLRQRRLTQAAFQRSRFSGYGEVMAQLAVEHVAQWKEGAQVDFSHEMMALTLKIAAKTLCGANVDSEIDELGEAVAVSVNMFRLAIMPFSETLQKLPLPVVLRFKRAKARLDKTIYRIIAERRADGKDHGDLLSILLTAQDLEGDHGKMTDLQIRDELMTLLSAGHETTANALSWTFYLLASHPDVATRLRRELEEVLGNKIPGADDVPKLVYTRQVLSEAMRLFPPSWAVGRRAVEEVEMGGYRIAKDSLVVASQWVVHRDKRFYESPERFSPERWAPEKEARRPKFAYFPFGGGNRQCIGEQFAWTEGILLMAVIARQWAPELVDEKNIIPEPLITLRPKYGIKMKLKKAPSNKEIPPRVFQDSESTSAK